MTMTTETETVLKRNRLRAEDLEVQRFRLTNQIAAIDRELAQLATERIATRASIRCGGTCLNCHAQASSDDEWQLGRMMVCRSCGNKRCPRADHHLNDCTFSNATGQIGSFTGVAAHPTPWKVKP